MPVPNLPSADTSETDEQSVHLVQQQQDISSLGESSSGKGGDLQKEEEETHQQKDLSRHSSKVGAFASEFLLGHICFTNSQLERTFLFYSFRCSNYSSFHYLHCPFFPSISAQKKRSILSSEDEGSDDEREADPTSAGGGATAGTGHSDDSVILVPDSQVCFLFFTSELHKSLEQFISSSTSSFFVLVMTLFST